MSAFSSLNGWGEDLTRDDYAGLQERWITRELADQSGLRRVTSLIGQEMFGRTSGDMAGVIIPNIAPWNPGHIREYRLRLDSPPMELRGDGSFKEAQKYVQPPGRRNLLYFAVGITQEILVDTRLPVLITEGEFKAMATWRCSNYESDSPRFVSCSVAGVWNYRGTTGKTVGPNGDRRDVKGIIPDLERFAWKGRRVIIAYDADAERNPMVRAARWQLITILIERGAAVGILEWPFEDGKGIDDWLAKVGACHVLAEIAKITFDDWRARLLRNDTGKLVACYENAALLLENSPEWAGVLAYNQFTGGYIIRKPAPAPIAAQVGQEVEDHFDTEVVRWLERKGVMARPEMVRRVVDAWARRNPYHPILEYLDSIPLWDGVKRIGTWLIDYCGVESSDEQPNGFAMVAGEKFLISAVARVLAPGCKVDTILVLEGLQGTFKSMVPRILAGDEYFSDRLGEMGSRDASMQLRGIWIMELSELDALNRVETSRAKSFLSQQTERFRLPYGHRIVENKRQCVFVGTTNSDTWLKDETGGRRYWPVRCRSIHVDQLKDDRDQLWAEALAAYRSGKSWWLEDRTMIEEAIEEQRGRFAEDVWQEKVIAFAEERARRSETGDDGRHAPRGYTAIPEILDRLGIEMAKQDQAAANRIARCLKAGGWERFQKRKADGTREWRYRPVDVTPFQRLSPVGHQFVTNT
jgi:predicted P-loop ATPase